MSVEEISSLNETLRNQLQTIGRLYNEIEDERKASSSGVDEVLTMILCLQKERAQEKTEAFQYKQMAELKLQHAEKSLAFLEELLYIKDIEIESLESDVQFYQKKLRRVELNEKFQFTSSKLLHRAKSCIQIKRHTSELTISGENSHLLPKVDTILTEIGEKVKRISSFVEAESTEFEMPKSTPKNSTPRKEISINMNQNILVKDEIEELKYKFEELARAVRNMKRCYLLEGNEQVRLLRLVFEQLKLIESHIRSLKSSMFSQQTSCKRSRKKSSMFFQQTCCKCSQKKSSMFSQQTCCMCSQKRSSKFSKQDKAIFASLTEAMLSFWI